MDGVVDVGEVVELVVEGSGVGLVVSTLSSDATLGSTCDWTVAMAPERAGAKNPMAPLVSSSMPV